MKTNLYFNAHCIITVCVSFHGWHPLDIKNQINETFTLYGACTEYLHTREFINLGTV